MAYDNLYAYHLKEVEEAKRHPVATCGECGRGILYMETYFDVYGDIVCDDCLDSYMRSYYKRVAYGD